MTLFYLGPKGTFSYLAALKLQSQRNQQEQLTECTNLYEVMSSLQKMPTASAIVPIENSIEGTINIVADALVEQSFIVVEEIVLDIAFALYGLPHQSINDIQKVYSIGPAISQTQKFIHHYQFAYDYTPSTVASLNKIDATSAAIAPVGSGEMYGYVALKSHIEDYPHNMTRFLVLKHASQVTQQTGTECLLIITPTEDKPGLLAAILNTFALFQVNLKWIESRPMKTQLGRYRFFVQAECPDTTVLNKILTILETLDFQIKHLGRFHK
ncbi:prephenate dehydratase [Staphylococcus lutrae]|uniref:Prephenate dehydratase n=1 Tax=Staphylococcus lutrae TaxID=155085 RepID=A0AAC9RSV3_9STAP|nr:prephenate dehydratase domain-containing protein [Staphylococcus lutrae]ARJ50185.1 prephenate dehydratase [Staphylococcus lutrae]PNZ39354.1 prephenate dehydratase [Staphylococcus lutrae]